VVKKGSKQRRRVSSSMPRPVSLTSTCACCRGGPPCETGALTESRVRTVSLTPPGIASTALKMRLVSATRISFSAATMVGRSGARSVVVAITTPRWRNAVTSPRDTESLVHGEAIEDRISEETPMLLRPRVPLALLLLTGCGSSTGPGGDLPPILTELPRTRTPSSPRSAPRWRSA
jgi:hypothetical protein